MSTPCIVIITDGSQMSVRQKPMDGSPETILTDIAEALDLHRNCMDVGIIAQAVTDINRKRNKPEVIKYFQTHFHIDTTLSEPQHSNSRRASDIHYIANVHWGYVVELGTNDVKVYSSLSTFNEGDEDSVVNPFRYLRVVTDEAFARVMASLIDTGKTLVRAGFTLNGEDNIAMMANSWPSSN